MVCGATPRSGGLCQTHPVKGKMRCRLHGGLSTGPKTIEGKQRIMDAHYKHGRRSKAFVLARRKIWADLRQKVKVMKEQGFIK